MTNCQPLSVWSSHQNTARIRSILRCWTYAM